MMGGASGLMLVSSQAVGLDVFVQNHVFGPWVLCDEYSILDEKTVERSFSYRNPDGYDILLKGYKKTVNGSFEPDVELFSESMSPTFLFLKKSHARFEIVIRQSGNVMRCETVSIDDVLSRMRIGPKVYNRYVLMHLDNNCIDVWKEFDIRVKVVDKSEIPMPDNIRIQLVVEGSVIL